ncbi:PAS domain-containing sensor histidine kinase [Cesiribacter andamanensis]|uniref:histidine kinase n=1 Tax=Cesiribacter andamanensis AMV16 TaxID=1279009 RepID=M7NS27_9BACT|nr:PAS domain-containing sensor histidine kinase [Cesiribacter andamanensis]EMR04505.1 Phytochrome-like protein cph1 [Cesiribacter andamanensis AMV16]
MQTTYTFTYFKDFARYLLNNHLPALARYYYQLLCKANAPLLSAVAHLSEEQQIAIARASIEDFLQRVQQNTALEGAQQVLDQWRQNQHQHFRRESIVTSDIVLTISARRKLYRQHLHLYTTDLQEGIRIMEDYDGFLTLLNQRTFEVYQEVQQEVLRRERNLFESVISNSVDGIIAFDKDLRILALNKVLEEHNGVKEADVVGKKIFEVFPGYEESEEGKSFLKVLKGEQIYLQNRPFRRKKGFYDVHTIPLFSSRGELQGGLSVVHDISLRKEQEDALRLKQQELQQQKDELTATVEELRASNEELEKTRRQLQELNARLEERVHQRTEQLEYQRQWLYKLFMQVPGLIGIVSGKEGSVVLYNEAFSRLWGGRQVLGLPMREAWPELEGQGYFEILDEVLSSGKTISLREFPGQIDRHNNGQLHQAYFNFTYSPYMNPSGETEGVILYGVDVTEQVEARRQTEQSEEKLSMALEAGQMGIWDYDPKTDTSTNSLLFHQLYGYDSPSLAWSFADYLNHIHPEHRSLVEKEFAKGLKKGSMAFEARILQRDGNSSWAAIMGKVYYNEQKEPIRIVGIMTDISERKRAEEELQQSHQELQRTNTDLDNFIYTASHDLRSPIVNLEGLISMLQRNLAQQLEAQNGQLLNMMTTSISRLKRTIDGLTDITRIQKEDEQRELLSIDQILQEVKQDVAGLLEESGARLETELQVPSLEFAPHNLRSILYNLLSNAIKYRKPDVPLVIRIQTYRHENHIVLSVEDNGLGINAANQKKLFSMFKRFHSHVRGSGIGLYLVKRIIENAGGRVEAQSQEGQGSRFCVYFPA